VGALPDEGPLVQIPGTGVIWKICGPGNGKAGDGEGD
jgi:hypothetical protein